MGTETCGVNDNWVRLLYPAVKLNNPLMGTETVFTYIFSLFFVFDFVKLNNPLMGTETISINFCQMFQDI